MRLPLNDDGRQEKALALLEGHSEEEAERRGRSMMPTASRARQLGRLNMRSLPMMVLGEVFETQQASDNFRMAFTDNRTAEQVEDDFVKRENALTHLDVCTDTQRAVIERRIGFTTGAPMTLQEVADDLGYGWTGAVERAEKRGYERIRRQLHALANPENITERAAARRARKRELNRVWMYNNRKQQAA